MSKLLEGTNVSYRRITNNKYSCSLLQEVELNSSPLEHMWVRLSHSLLSNRM